MQIVFIKQSYLGTLFFNETIVSSDGLQALLSLQISSSSIFQIHMRQFIAIIWTQESEDASHCSKALEKSTYGINANGK